MKDIIPAVIAFLIVVCVVFFGGRCALSKLPPPPSPSEHTSAYKAKVEQDGGTLTIKHGERLLTIEHDGHLFVIHQDGRGSSMIHHPGCECPHTTQHGEAGQDEG